MTAADRELLDLAAKAMIAAGQPLLWAHNHDEPEPYWMLDFEPWCPRDNDGHALRLAVALDINIFFFRKHVDVMAESRWQLPVREDFEREWKKGAATRLAILRAAAEIGRALP